MSVTTIGIDLAKSVFQVHGLQCSIDRAGMLGVSCVRAEERTLIGDTDRHLCLYR
jgi:hypothetical protein